MKNKKGKFRINNEIRSEIVVLIDENGEMIGKIASKTAMIKAKNAGMDLVEVSPNARPPVCKILDYGKLKYKEQKKVNMAKKKQKNFSVKEVRMTANIEKGDFETKFNKIIKFLEKGNKVSVWFRFKGRELGRTEIVNDLVEKIIEGTSEIGKVESSPRMSGRSLSLTLSPK